MKALEIEIETNRGITKTVPVNEIDLLSYDGEPTKLNDIRKKISEEDYEDAEATLKTAKVDENKRPEIQADVDFYKALCAARRALGGNGDIAAAGGEMIAFQTKNPNNYHYLEACEVVGDLLVAKGLFPKAEEYYQKLAQAPWEDYKMRAGVGIGRAQLAMGKAATALKTFKDVLSNESVNPQTDMPRQLAKLGEARCLVATGKTEEAVKLAQAAIAKLTPKDVGLTPRPTIPWARPCARRRPSPRTTSPPRTPATRKPCWPSCTSTFLYSGTPETHAEALANLFEVFTELHKSDHAGICRKTLIDRYPLSPWTARVK